MDRLAVTTLSRDLDVDSGTSCGRVSTVSGRSGSPLPRSGGTPTVLTCAPRGLHNWTGRAVVRRGVGGCGVLLCGQVTA